MPVRLMSRSSATRPYKWLAEYYDKVFTFHHEWFEAVHAKLLAPVMPKVSVACDLCCGTGATAVHLARQGIRTYAVDLSPGMCRATRAKAREAGVRVRVSRGDMREFTLPEPVDLITSECDAINHLPEAGDLPRVAAAVAAALRPGGWFFFDVNNRAAFDTVWQLNWWIDRGDVSVAMEGGSEGDRAWTDVHWFIREGGLWRRHEERVEEVCWPASEIKDVLRGAGFDRIRCWDAAPLLNNPMTRPGYRTFYLARKAKQ